MVALWALAVMVHALFLASPALWFRASRSAAILEQVVQAPARCRVLLLGSSPVIFGLSAAEIEAATGCTTGNVGMVAVNHVLNPYLDEVLQRARPGDVVVLSDKQWLKASAGRQACEDGPWLLCLAQSLHWVPNLREDLVRFRDMGLARSARGDLLQFPPRVPNPGLRADAPLEHIAHRIERMADQVQRIRAHGARPVLAPPPILAEPAALAEVQARVARVSQLALERLGPGVWLPPLIHTDPALISLDSEHASLAGRARWTGQLQAALSATQPSLGLVTGR